tara:strand:+ start:558 stop:1601 length:1044 start_codon:yes stop_codon:yes gene_type:complete
MIGPVSLFMIGYSLINIMDVFKGKIILTEDKIIQRSTLINRSLDFDDIKGFFVSELQTIIIPKDESKKRVIIKSSIEKRKELGEFLISNFANLNDLAIELEEGDIVSNHKFGKTEAERELRLNSAKKTAKILNWGSGLIAAWYIFNPLLYNLVTWICILIPILIIACIVYFRGLLKIHDRDDQSAFPSVFNGLAYCCAAICLRSYFDYDLLYSNEIYLIAFIYSGILTSIILMITRNLELKAKKDLIVVLYIGLFFFVHGIGTIKTINCTLDNSPPKVYEAKVLSKRKDQGTKLTTYKFKLSPWGPFQDNNNINVNKILFEITSPNQNIHVCVYEGFFKIPWYIAIE